MKKYFVFLMMTAALILAGCGEEESSSVFEKKPEVPVEGISIEKNATEIMVSRKELLYVTISPSNATNKKAIWTSSNDAVATVDPWGEVTAVKEGTATMTVTTEDGGFSATCVVTVIPFVGVPVTGVTLNANELSLAMSQKYAMTATITPAEADIKTVEWSSSNPGVASISAEGIVEGLSAGTTTITVTTVDGGFTANCSVTVTSDFLISDFERDEIGTKYPVYYSNNNDNGICEVELEPLDMEVKSPTEAVTVPRGTGKALHLYGTQGVSTPYEYGVTGQHMGPEFEVTLPAGTKLGDYKFLHIDLYFVTGIGNGGTNAAAAGNAGWGSPRLNIKMDDQNSVFVEDFGGNPQYMGSLTFPENDPFSGTYWGAYTWAKGIEFDLSKLALSSEYQSLTTFKLGLSIRSGAINCFMDNVILKK